MFSILRHIIVLSFLVKLSLLRVSIPKLQIKKIQKVADNLYLLFLVPLDTRRYGSFKKEEGVANIPTPIFVRTPGMICLAKKIRGKKWSLYVDNIKREEKNDFPDISLDHPTTTQPLDFLELFLRHVDFYRYTRVTTAANLSCTNSFETARVLNRLSD